MKKFLWITIDGSVLAALTANGAPQPFTSPAAPAQGECDCRLVPLEKECKP
jgi:hypothetical protein